MLRRVLDPSTVEPDEFVRLRKHQRAGVEAIEEAGGKGMAVSADVRDPESIAAAFDAIEAELGPVSVPVNNAAATSRLGGPTGQVQDRARGGQPLRQLILRPV